MGRTKYLIENMFQYSGGWREARFSEQAVLQVPYSEFGYILQGTVAGKTVDLGASDSASLREAFARYWNGNLPFTRSPNAPSGRRFEGGHA